MKNLSTYNKKRDFKKTSEPKGEVSTSTCKDFMVHLHDARRLHYDLRLQWQGVLLSWAVPKGPSFDPSDKRLAVQTEDHPVEYKSFEGTIPEKAYGSGPSLIWDAGTWEPLVDDVNAALKKGHLKFSLDGARLKGKWSLIKLKAKEKNKTPWLLFKEKDEFAIEGWAKSVKLDAKPNVSTEVSSEWHTSVATGRHLTELDDAVVETREDKPNIKTEDKDAGVFADGALTLTPTAFPTVIKPQLATLATSPPSDLEDWTVERKYDGYRIIAFKKKDSVKLVTRNGHDWSEKFKVVKEAVAKIPVDQIVLDGEIVAYEKKKVGTAKESFQALQSFVKDGEATKLNYKIFDILYLDKFSTQHLPQKSRREILTSLCEKLDVLSKSKILSISEELNWSESLLDKLCLAGHEGVMLKHQESSYEEKRSRSWLKLKCGQREEYVVVGWTDPQGEREHFGALLLAEEVDGKLQYRGKVGTGFNDKKLESIFKQLSKLKVDDCPMEDCEEASAHFIKPSYFAEIRFTERSKDNRLRHPVFLGFRDDKFYEGKQRKQRRRSKPNLKKASSEKLNAKKLSPKKKLSKASGHKQTDGNAGAQTFKKKSSGSKFDNTYKTSVVLSHPDRVLYDDIKLTKQDLLDYYHLVFEEFQKMGLNRPLSFLRCPQGFKEKCFFQKHLEPDDGHPQQVSIKTTSGKKPYSFFKTFDDLAALVQLGTLEFHGWNCSVKDTETPQFVVWDIDPGPGVKFSQVTQTAHLIRLVLEDQGKESWVRTTGGKGLHVLTHVEGMDWKQAKAYSLEIAKILVDAKPDLYLTTSTLKLRKNKIFIDYLRNSKSSTSVLNYSTRVRAGAPVAVPLDWKEVHEDLDPQFFSIPETIKRVAKQAVDPWKSFYAGL